MEPAVQLADRAEPSVIFNVPVGPALVATTAVFLAIGARERHGTELFDIAGAVSAGATGARHTRPAMSSRTSPSLTSSGV